jgi:membrane protease YdiL (CAAX protease family)
MAAISNLLKTFALRVPIVFAVVCSLIVMGVAIAFDYLAPVQQAGVLALLLLVIIFLFAVGMLAWLGWLRDAGFNSPSQWQDLRVLWPLVLLTLVVLAQLLFSRPSNITLPSLALALLYALLTGLNEEAFARGLLLQTLLPYGVIPAAVLSALLFALLHLNNLFTGVFAVILFVFIQVLYAFFFGIAMAAFRLRTRTIWPLILLHACIDLPVDIGIFTRSTSHAIGPQALISLIVLVVLTFLLACYGLFLLRPRKQTDKKPALL